MTKEVLSVSHLTAGYGNHPAVEDVSFSLNKGEILCLVGESGCGKSTMLKALMAAPEIRLISGTITMGGTVLSDLPPKARRRICCDRMGIVFQTPEITFNPIRSYRRQFIETLKSHNKYDPASFDTQAAAAFARVNLKDWKRVLDECPFALSGGMNQRTALALALLLEQEILLCDEPTSALDATIQLQTALELKKLRAGNGVTQIIVTHNLALARFLADHIGVMYAGRLAEFGRTEDVLNTPRHPYTKSLIAAIPSLDGRMPEGLPGSPPMTGPSGEGCEFMDRCPAASESCAGRPYSLQNLGGGHYASCCGQQKRPDAGSSDNKLRPIMNHPIMNNEQPAILTSCCGKESTE